MQQQRVIVTAFIYKGQEVLIVKRSNNDDFFPGVFELPGGKLEFGEKLEEGLKREIKEEVGANILIGEPFHVFSYFGDSQTYCVEITYLAKLKNENINVTLNPLEHSEYKWINENEVEKYFEGNKDGEVGVKIGFKKLSKNV